MSNDALRTHLVRLLEWHDAHADFDAAVAGLGVELRGVRPPGLPYSAWELLEHLRITQLDILEFCRNPAYAEPKWPEEYWPTTGEPPTAEAWERSVAAFREDRDALAALARDEGVDLFARIPHGSGQTYLRELLLVADHNSYHVGEIVALRRLLGAWPSA
jgi:hypothetical protein